MLLSLISLVAGLGLATGPAGAPPAGPPLHKVAALKITILSTMLADQGMGEWGFSALVEVDGRRILFDTGLRPETVLQNARELGIDLSGVTDVVLSHHHGDHTGGLLALRRELSKASPTAMSRIHVAPGIFLSRRHSGSEEEANPTIALKSAMEATGAVFVEHRKPEEIFPGVWLTGPVPRPNPERYWGPPANIVTGSGVVPDSIPEDMSLLVNTDKGFVVVAGCGHAGTINTVEYARHILGTEPAYAVIGGLHLFAAPDSALAWTAARLRSAQLGYLLGAHCTGIEAVFRIRDLAALDRKRAVVAAVGSSFDASKGINPLSLAQ
ncbi:MAG TPA: MBL fold metallo-hydrolase [Gemmatimonadales bacterium]|nr:MBL fold metallo-hydrolase [Gemmatimonadales bacterium]